MMAIEFVAKALLCFIGSGTPIMLTKELGGRSTFIKVRY